MSKHVTTCGWDDVPHLSEEEKDELLLATPEYLRRARKFGEPSLGAGAIYPISIEQVCVEPFKIPDYWPRAYGFDVGWNRTASIWGAMDRDSNVMYLYDEYYRSEAEPVIHAAAIKRRGAWIKGAIDPASRGRGQKDGAQLFADYTVGTRENPGQGLKLVTADNTVESGIYDCWQAFSLGQLRIFTTLRNTIAEYKIYRRDEKGRVVKQNDHLMDAMRYLRSRFATIGKVMPIDTNRVVQPFEPFDKTIGF